MVRVIVVRKLAMQWKEITAERYMEALETVRPTLWLPYGFLRGGKAPISAQATGALDPARAPRNRLWRAPKGTSSRLERMETRGRTRNGAS